MTIEVRDLSRRYFGDYHKVVLEVTCRLPLRSALFAGDGDPEQALRAARAALGDEARTQMRLERMGVPGASLEAVRSALWDSFTRTTLRYMQRDDYPLRLVRSLVAKRRQTRPPLRPVP
ncbi:hypothetical protein [Geoalkalibacter halelectricus]|uniref:Uncharacterized protein n=1 Tax=Geoalkalibacter halelectricus TaxID=2847045 RepID=A0ABY5ZS60_9BACT|nr:hypothetical protein [Geoalkalibacter halelectricus]UWZ81359.1 hypothetical protein L9S41_08190 [Geoalkalibacter halelectricus]